MTEHVSMPDSADSVRIEPLADAHLVRLPDPSAGGIEGLIGQANQRRLADAIARIEVSFPGLVACVNAGSHPASEVGDLVVLPAALKVSDEEMWSVVDRVLHHDDARPGRLQLGIDNAAEGVDDQLDFDTSYDIARPHLGQLAQKLVDAASMSLRAVGAHLDVLEKLSGDLETLLGFAVEVDVVVFGAGSTHVDPPDRGGHLLLVPIDVLVSAQHGASDKQASPITVILEPGRAVFASAGDSVQLQAEAVGLAVRVILPVISSDVLRQHAAGAARYHPLLRADLPTDLDAPIESYGGSLYAHPGGFDEEARGALGADAQNRAAARLRALLPPRPLGGLSEMSQSSLGEFGYLVSPLVGGVMVTHLHDRLSLVAGGSIIDLEPGLAELLSPQFDGRLFDPVVLLSREISDTTGTIRGDPSCGVAQMASRNPLFAAVRALLRGGFLESVS